MSWTRGRRRLLAAQRLPPRLFPRRWGVLRGPLPTAPPKRAAQRPLQKGPPKGPPKGPASPPPRAPPPSPAPSPWREGIRVLACPANAPFLPGLAPAARSFFSGCLRRQRSSRPSLTGGARQTLAQFFTNEKKLRSLRSRCPKGPLDRACDLRDYSLRGTQRHAFREAPHKAESAGGRNRSDSLLLCEGHAKLPPPELSVLHAGFFDVRHCFCVRPIVRQPETDKWRPLSPAPLPVVLGSRL